MNNYDEARAYIESLLGPEDLKNYDKKQVEMIFST